MHSTIKRSSGFFPLWCAASELSAMTMSFGPLEESFETSSSYIRIKAFMECCSASSCLPICERIAQMLRWMSQGFETWRQSSTACWEK